MYDIGDIRTQAQFDVEKTGMQSAIFRANADLERSIGDWSAASLRAGGAALAGAANSSADATLATGLGRVAEKAPQLLGGIDFGSMFGGGNSGALDASLGNPAANAAVAASGPDLVNY